MSRRDRPNALADKNSCSSRDSRWLYRTRGRVLAFRPTRLVRRRDRSHRLRNPQASSNAQCEGSSAQVIVFCCVIPRRATERIGDGITSRMTPLPFSPFLDITLVEPDNRFVLDQNRFLTAILEPDDKMPIFLDRPSPAFLDAIRRDLTPLLMDHARRG